MAPTYGRGPRGEWVEGVAPHGHWKTTMLLAALRHDDLTAACVFDGAITGARLRAWVEQALAPTLAPGDVGGMDNLAAHKVAGIPEAIEAKGAELAYLPAYSPDLNPIEPVFAELKALLCGAGSRRVDDLWRAIDRCLDACTPTDCANYLANLGSVPR